MYHLVWWHCVPSTGTLPRSCWLGEADSLQLFPSIRLYIYIHISFFWCFLPMTASQLEFGGHRKISCQMVWFSHFARKTPLERKKAFGLEKTVPEHFLRSKWQKKHVFLKQSRKKQSGGLPGRKIWEHIYEKIYRKPMAKHWKLLKIIGNSSINRG